jgi:pimeloyl-ACP methyl ester carboxylesterase
MDEKAAADNETLDIRLKHGRTLSYAVTAIRLARPASISNGHPGSRLEGRFATDAARQHGIRIIAVDRPGYGRSSDKPGRRIIDWPNDVVELADALGIEKFYVVGASGGGPFSLVCAARLPDRVIAAGVASGIAPMNAPGATDGMRALNKIAFKYASHLPLVPGLIMNAMARKVRKDPEGALKQMKESMSAPDREALDRDDLGKQFMAIVEESFRNGTVGATAEIRLLGKPWGFRLEDITIPVYLWQGTEDRLVPESMGRYLADAIPGCKATFVEGEGHLLVLKRTEEIIFTISPLMVAPRD